jgi:hypothetical protein
MGVKTSAVVGDDPGALLTPMLEGIQAQIGELAGLPLAADAEYPALFVKLVHGEHDVKDRFFEESLYHKIDMCEIAVSHEKTLVKI